MTKTFDVRTHARDEMLDITDQVAAAIRQAAVQEGTVTVWAPHTTAGVTINENADPDVVHEIAVKLDSMLAFRPRVRQVARNALPRFEMKAKRFHVKLDE